MHTNPLFVNLFIGLAATVLCNPFGIAQEPAKKALPKPPEVAVVVPEKSEKEPSKWKPLMEKDSLKGWEITNFGGEGDVDLKEGVLRLDRGQPMTGITTIRKDFPKENFEIRWKASRVDGSDFFAGVTFPVGDEFCSLICGGWGGGLIGLSSIDGNDASENEATGYRQFKNKQWYAFRIRVDKTHITAWIDEEEVIRVEREKKKFSLRGEVFKSKPLGYCVFESIVDIKEWEYQILE